MESTPLNKNKKYNADNKDKLAKNIYKPSVDSSHQKSLNNIENEVLATNSDPPVKILSASIAKKHYYLDECFGRYIF